MVDQTNNHQAPEQQQRFLFLLPSASPTPTSQSHPQLPSFHSVPYPTILVAAADPSEFAVGLGVGYGHVVDKVFASVERAPMPNSVVAALLAVPALFGYLLAATLAFAVRVAADGYARIVAPAAVLSCFYGLVIMLVAFALFGALAYHFGPGAG